MTPFYFRSNSTCSLEWCTLLLLRHLIYAFSPSVRKVDQDSGSCLIAKQSPISVTNKSSVLTASHQQGSRYDFCQSSLKRTFIALAALFTGVLKSHYITPCRTDISINTVFQWNKCQLVWAFSRLFLFNFVNWPCSHQNVSCCIQSLSLSAYTTCRIKNVRNISSSSVSFPFHLLRYIINLRRSWLKGMVKWIACIKWHEQQFFHTTWHHQQRILAHAALYSE